MILLSLNKYFIDYNQYVHPTLFLHTHPKIILNLLQVIQYFDLLIVNIYKDKF